MEYIRYDVRYVITSNVITVLTYPSRERISSQSIVYRKMNIINSYVELRHMCFIYHTSEKKSSRFNGSK